MVADAEGADVIHWLVLQAATLPGDPAAYLSRAEQETAAALKSDKRRRDWLLGRWTAKRLLQQAVAHYAGRMPALTAIVINKRADGSPEAQWDAGDFPFPAVSLSVSHAGELAFCAAVFRADFPLGADVELIEPRSQAFVEDYFTPAEQALVHDAPAADRDAATTVIWSAKEAALKAARAGLTLDTRSVECLPSNVKAADSWQPLALVWRGAVAQTAPLLNGRLRIGRGYVLTLAAAPPAAPASDPALPQADIN